MVYAQGAFPHEWRTLVKNLADRYFKVGAADLGVYLNKADSPQPLKVAYAGIAVPVGGTLQYPFSMVYSLRGTFGPETVSRGQGEATDRDTAMFYVAVGSLAADWGVLESEAIKWVKPVLEMFYDNRALSGEVLSLKCEGYQMAPVMKVGGTQLFGVGFPLSVTTLRRRTNR